MGREIRKVPPDWKHPTDEKGKFISLFDEDFESAAREWIERFGKVIGEQPDTDGAYFWEDDPPPDREHYRQRKWTEEEATYIQVYETVSEGTPVTPAFAGKDELIEYLVSHGDFWDQHRGQGGWSRKAAEQLVECGFALSLMVVYEPGVGAHSSLPVVPADTADTFSPISEVPCGDLTRPSSLNGGGGLSTERSRSC